MIDERLDRSNEPPQTTTTAASRRLAGYATMHAVKRIEIRWRDLDGFGTSTTPPTSRIWRRRATSSSGSPRRYWCRVVIRHVEIDFLSASSTPTTTSTSSSSSRRFGRRAQRPSSASARPPTAASPRRRDVVVHTDAGRSASEPWPDESHGRSRRGCDAPRPLGRRAARPARGRRDRDLDDRPGRRGRDRRRRPAPVGARPGCAAHPAPRPRSRGGDLLRPRRERAHGWTARRRGRGRRLHRPPGRRGGPRAEAGPDGLDVLSFGMRQYAETCYHPHSGRAGRVRRSWLPTAPATCSRSTPRRGRRWAAPAPRARKHRRTRRRRRAPERRGRLRVGLRRGLGRRGRAVRTASTSAASCRDAAVTAALPLRRGGALRHPRRLGHLHPGRRGPPLRPGHVVSRPAGTGVAHALREGRRG